MIRVLLASVFVIAIGGVAYVLLFAVGAVVGGWDASVAGDQAVGLALHLGVVALRGLLPALWLALALAWAHAAWLGDPARGARLAWLTLLASAAVVPTLLTLDTGTALPHLRIDGAWNVAATVALLALASFGAIQAARWLRPLPS